MSVRKSAVGFLSLLFSLCFSTPTAAQNAVIDELFGFPCDAVTGVCPDGSAPAGSLVQASDGNFYGTTIFGTVKSHGGTVFKISPHGHFTSLEKFVADKKGQFSDGDFPVGGLVEGKDGFLYGSTRMGGAHDAGVIFKISKCGGFKVLHSFCSAAECADGANPTPLVLGNDGNLYGGTTSGATSNNGSIFRITPSGSLSTLHALNKTTDGGPPNQALVQASDGNFYGVGGISPTGVIGSLFRVTPAGQFTDIHDMGHPPDAAPNARLIQASNGLLYGATFYGEVFQISLTGSFQIVVPGNFDTIFGGVIQSPDGNLWGTHSGRGIFQNADALFANTLGGSNLLNVSFDCSINGGDPQGVIQGADGKLYGVATVCGVDSQNHAAGGTVFTVDAGLTAPQAVIAAFMPVRGNVGSLVTISGDHFVGVSAVAFNGVEASFKVLNAKFLRATVPVGATTGPITVTNAGGTTVSKHSFNVTER
jgi:uncharacterized repeat protein (TIGR03803 family)